MHTIMSEANRANFPVPIETLTANMPVRRLGEPEDIANACAWLCDERSGYVTGQTIIVGNNAGGANYPTYLTTQAGGTGSIVSSFSAAVVTLRRSFHGWSRGTATMNSSSYSGCTINPASGNGSARIAASIWL